MALILKSHNSVSLKPHEFARISSRIFQKGLQHGPRLAAANRFLHRMQAWLAWGLKVRKIVIASPQVDAKWKAVLDPGKIASVRSVGEELGSPFTASIQPNLSLYGSSPMSHHHSSRAQVSVCKRNFMGWPFNRVPRFPAVPNFTLAYGIPNDFHSQMLYGLLFPALLLWAGETVWG